MKKKKKEKREIDFENIHRILRDVVPSCRICGGPLIVTCDRSKKSVLTEVMGMGWMKTAPEYMWMYPTAEEQSDLCFYHQWKKNEGEVI